MYTPFTLAPPLLLLLSCATQSAATSTPEAIAAGGAGAPSEDDRAPQAWNSRTAIRHIFPQGTVLSEARPLCPFLYQRSDSGAEALSVTYDSGEFHKAPFSLRLSFRSLPGASGGWGIGCLRQYDVRLYNYMTFWLKGLPGTKYRFVLKDSASMEALIDREITLEGWHQVTVPLAALKGVNLGSLESFSLRFTARTGAAELHVDEFEFVTR